MTSTMECSRGTSSRSTREHKNIKLLAIRIGTDE